MQSRIKIASIAIIFAGVIITSSVYVRPILIRSTNNLFSDAGFADSQLARTRRTKIIQSPITSTPVSTLYADSFGSTSTTEEAGNMSGSGSILWWISSGAYFYNANGVGATISGSLSATNPWRVAYYLSNPTDTDNGYHPQNIFRLVTRSTWQNYTQEVYTKTTALNLSASAERDAWSGIFFFNRYQDQNNLYYTGIRDDGHVVIKAKKNGTYTTLAEKAYWPGTYNRSTNPSLLPQNTWVGIKSEVTTLPDNTVSIKFYVDEGRTGVWTLALSAIDTKSPILNTGYGGIRGDFRDIQFDDYKIMGI